MPRIKAETVVGGSRNIIRLQIKLKIGPFLHVIDSKIKYKERKTLFYF